MLLFAGTEVYLEWKCFIFSELTREFFNDLVIKSRWRMNGFDCLLYSVQTIIVKSNPAFISFLKVYDLFHIISYYAYET